MLIDNSLISSLAVQAAASPRRRQHYNLHSDYSDPSQRLLNFLYRDSYIRPHRHATDPKPETLVALRGTMGCIIFDDAGHVKEYSWLIAGGSCPAIVIEPGEWHTIVVLSATALLLETKAGPFNPDAAKEPAFWAVEEQQSAAILYLQSLQRLFDQSRVA